MQRYHYTLSIPEDQDNRRLVVSWLLLALGSLVGSGLVVILVVLARTPLISAIIPWVASFRTALVVHVDLSVLVWFLAFAGALAAITLNRPRPVMERTGLWPAVVGAVIIALSPFLGPDLPFMNNYVPVLKNWPFFIGLALLLGGFLVMTVLGLIPDQDPVRTTPEEAALRFGLKTALAIIILAALVQIQTQFKMPLDSEKNQEYFEMLFWGSGHVLQFAHTQLLLLAWLWLASEGGVAPPVPASTVIAFFAVGALPVVVAPAMNAVYAIDSMDLRLAYTSLMIYGNGLATIPLGLAILWGIFKGPRSSPATVGPERTALLLSLLLFAVGGLVGFLIQGGNVTIPAHYHGSIIGVTTAYMGLTYHLLPKLGFRAPPPRLARWQLRLYGLGSVAHILGLAWSGEHGVPRKTPGIEQGLDALAAKLPMAIMGTGGILAVTGGLLFLVLAFRAMRHGRDR
ncbi:MAG: cbb3-type cytochrome c oxidase subunit I [Magnetococcales bacterium]|nr:cbb3-type cytochrome c oxidase subunit I [Magnetococcales bacterium]MBF0157860.1 cbb3-type cytochrome c oxidase subunit I [Magnetococcales bacterium]